MVSCSVAGVKDGVPADGVWVGTFMVCARDGDPITHGAPLRAADAPAVLFKITFTFSIQPQNLIPRRVQRIPHIQISDPAEI